MANKEPLDYLVEALDELSDSENTSDTNQNQCNNLRQITNPITPISSPEKISNLAIKNLSSSSLKKRQKKTSNCKYCIRFTFSSQQLENHMLESEVCASLYMRHERVNTIDGVLLKIFKCLCCCSKENFKLKIHLERNNKCKKFYENKFKCQTWNDIKATILKLTRISYSFPKILLKILH